MLYHVTKQSRLLSICRQGLTPGKRRQWSNVMGGVLGEKGKIYLFSHFDSAIRFAAKGAWAEKSQRWLILTIDFPESLLTPDPCIEAQLDPGHWWMTDKWIPPEAIVKVTPLTNDLVRDLIHRDNETMESTS